MLINRSTRKQESIIVFTTIIYYALIDAVTIMVGREGSRTGGVILIGQLAIVIIMFLLFNRGRFGFKVTAFHLYFIVFVTYCFVNCLWAVYPNSALARTEQLAETAIVMMILYTVFSHQDNAVDDLLTVIMVGGWLLMAIYILFYGWSYIVLSLQNSERISSEYINANTLGMAASYSCIIFFHRKMKQSIKMWWIPLVALSVVVVLISQSRKAVLILIIGLLAIFTLDNYKDKASLRVIKRIVLAIISITLLFIILKKTGVAAGSGERLQGLMNSLVGGRNVDKSTSMRNAFLVIGLNLFKDNPIGGVGIDCARYFTTSLYGYNYHLHNNYIELLADGGIIGLVAYYWIYAHILVYMIKKRNFNNPEYNICFVLLLLRIVMDFGFFSYKDQSTYFFLLLTYLFYRKNTCKTSNLKTHN